VWVILRLTDIKYLNVDGGGFFKRKDLKEVIFRVCFEVVRFIPL